jgi:DNA-binding response OmpR family regulator
LLALFLKRSGCALTREEILKQVWGYDILVTTRSVDRCVTTLRNKIERNSRDPVFIKTIRDVSTDSKTTIELAVEFSCY